MSNLQMFDLAVVGESMSGKSTWIANLYKEDITKKLKEIYQFNKEGQTKNLTYYILYNENEVDLRVENIKLSKECLENYLKGKSTYITFEILKEFIGFDIEDKDIDNNDEFKKAVRKIDPFKLLKKIVNNEKVLEEGIITYIELGGSASDDVRELLNMYNLEKIRIRDTRGFLDETEDKMLSFLNNEKKNSSSKNKYVNSEKEHYFQKLLDERGVYGIDACVFMSISNSNALLKKNVKEIYGSLIRALLEKYPTFLVARDTELTRILAKAENESYYDCCVQVLEDEFFTGFDDIRKLLAEFGLKEQTRNYEIDIARKHYKELLLANVSEKRILKDKELYRKSAVGVLKEILKGIKKYHSDIAEASKCLKKILEDHNEIVKEIFNKYFDKSIVFYSNYKYCGYDSNAYSNYSDFLVRKIKGKYFGGLVGVYEGLSTPIPGGGHVGDAAIDILETSYFIKEIIYFELIEKLTPDIQNYMKSVMQENSNVDLAVSEMKEKLMKKYRSEMDRNFERLSITGRMIPRWFLHKAYEETHKELDKEGQIEKCLKENLFSGETWKKDRCNIAVVKFITWRLIFNSMSMIL